MPDSARHSEAAEAELITDPQQVAYKEIVNGLKQFETVEAMVHKHLRSDAPRFRFRPSHLLDLHRPALAGLSKYAGVWRMTEVVIHGSRHQPPEADAVPGAIEELCDYVNDHWQDKSPIHLSSYVMWKLNWIHPFTDGNGRTSRAASYFVLCMKLGYFLPGQLTIPDQISDNKDPYYEALEAADAKWAEGIVDLTAMKELLSSTLAKQLLAVHGDSAKGDL